MSGLFSSLLSIKQFKKNDNIDQKYKRLRYQILISLYVGYGGYYFTRKSFNYVLPAFIVDFGLDKSDIGLLGTIFYITYGFSKFLSGFIVDNSNPRYFMGIGLIATGLLNILCGLSSSIFAFSILWVANAFFQGWGWPSCSKLLTTWYSRTERGLWWSVWNTAHNVGNASLSILVGYLTLNYGWREGMILPGILGILIGLFLCSSLRGEPATLGLPTIGVWRNDQLEISQENYDMGLSYKYIIKKYVFGNKYIWLLALSYILIYVVRIGIIDWGNLYLTEQHGYDLITANSVLALFELGGLVGSLVAGKGADSLFHGNRIPITVIFSGGIFLSVSAFWLMPSDIFALRAACSFTIGFFVCGPQMLVCMAAAECSHKKSPGASTGFISLFAYVGAAIAAYPLAIVVENYHWNGFFTVLTVASATIGLVLLPFLKAQLLANKIV
ncbi:MFS transporter family glucose-6-phosphate receptor UhpC [Vibrio atypicus]|uniref:MFS transporter family glucose-6-phosphate receptor UhpC n=1 Tax=Vibrio atypicus TaxID=558271 RepID=UPI0037369F45